MRRVKKAIALSNKTAGAESQEPETKLIEKEYISCVPFQS